MRGRPGITFVEILIVAGLVGFFVVCALPKLKRAQGEPRSGTGVLVDIKRIAAAKDQYAAEHQTKLGDPVTMKQLVKGGYLPGTPKSLPPGSRFVVGPIGAAVTIVSAEEQHSEPEHDEHSHAADHPKTEGP